MLKIKIICVLTTNVDHQFQRAGFDSKRLFYTQGDYGLWQCSVPCHQETYDNEEIVREMIEKQKDMKVPTELVPRCPHCHAPLTMNLRCDNTFVQDEGWYQAYNRYEDFLRRHENCKVLYLELGVGGNTPVLRSLSTRRKLRKNMVKQQIQGYLFNKSTKYGERRCA